MQVLVRYPGCHISAHCGIQIGSSQESFWTNLLTQLLSHVDLCGQGNHSIIHIIFLLQFSTPFSKILPHH